MARARFVSHPGYVASIGAHVFPMEKFALAREGLLATGKTEPADWIDAEPATREQLELVHERAYLDDFFGCRWTHRTIPSELPLDEALVDAYVLMAGGTIAAARAALETGFAMNLGGGFHHAFADHAEGFCYLNDLAVAIRVLQEEGAVKRALVIDCDLHQGNGTAHIFGDDDTVYTFSMHQERLYPVKEESDWDIGLPDPAGDALYLSELRSALADLFARAEPDLVLYQAGADPFEEDQLGNLGISMAGLAERDRLVFEACAHAGVPVAGTFGGGYARDARDTVAIHVHTCEAAIAAAALAARTGTRA
jgi:acetoin utilization deacetylase AcuC-like enzyme